MEDETNESYAITDGDIRYIFNNKIKIVKYSELIGYDNLDHLLYPYNRVVILIQAKKNYGHWVCIFYSDKLGKYFFFDSYGGKLDSQLKHLPLNIRKMFREDKQYLTNLIEDNQTVYYNKYKLQKHGEKIATCGRWCISRLLFPDLTSEEFYNLFKSKSNDTDKLVTEFTNNLFLNN